MGAVAAGAEIVGREKAGGAVQVVHLADVGGAGQDVRPRIVRIRAEVVLAPQLPEGRRHDLHQPHGAGMAGDRLPVQRRAAAALDRSEEHTSELQSLMRISYAVFCLKKTKIKIVYTDTDKEKNRVTRTSQTSYTVQCSTTKIT